MPDYAVQIKMLMPGNSKESIYPIFVKGAENPADAIGKAIEEWKRVTEPRDVSVKEVQRNPS